MPPPIVPVSPSAPLKLPTVKPKAWVVAVGIAAPVALLVIFGECLEPMRFFGPTKAFICISLCLAALFIFVGYGINGRPLGALIDSRNLMSLSRFQMVIWSILIMGAYITYVFVRYHCKIDQVADVEMDEHLWALLGISTASLVGSPLILSTKTDKTADPTAVAKITASTAEPAQEINDNSKGLVYTNTNMSDASFADMFQGDEIGNTMQVDLGKVQMFLFTIVVALSFIWGVRHALATIGWAVAYPKDVPAGTDIKVLIGNLPTLSQGAIALLGISHAGYLSAKSVNHTKTQ